MSLPRRVHPHGRSRPPPHDDAKILPLADIFLRLIFWHLRKCFLLLVSDKGASKLKSRASKQASSKRKKRKQRAMMLLLLLFLLVSSALAGYHHHHHHHTLYPVGDQSFFFSSRRTEHLLTNRACLRPRLPFFQSGRSSITRAVSCFWTSGP